MRSIPLFILFVLAGGAGGLVGSIVGAFFGQRGLFIGGFVGGLVTAPEAAIVARWLGWLERSRVRGAALGAAGGFVAAALVTVATLSTPVGALTSPLLIGIGGLLGARYAGRS